MCGHDKLGLLIFCLIQKDQTKRVNIPRSSPPADSTTPPRKPAAVAALMLKISIGITGVFELPLDKQATPRGPAIPPIPTKKRTQTKYPTYVTQRVGPVITESSSKKSSGTGFLL